VVRLSLQPELEEEVEVIALVEDLDGHLGVKLLQAPDLAVLLGHELLVEGGDLKEQVVSGKVKVGPERRRRLPGRVTVEDELDRLVLPGDAVKVQQLRQLTLRVVGKTD
jgi:hypothetical protein